MEQRLSWVDLVLGAFLVFVGLRGFHGQYSLWTWPEMAGVFAAGAGLRGPRFLVPGPPRMAKPVLLSILAAGTLYGIAFFLKTHLVQAVLAPVVFVACAWFFGLAYRGAKRVIESVAGKRTRLI